MLMYTVNGVLCSTGLSWEELQQTLSERYDIVAISESSFSIISELNTMAVYNKA